jgi:hypothetical protein
LRSVSIQSTNITTLSNSLFQGCNSLAGITIPLNVTSIGVSTFESTGLISILISNNLKTIGDYAFQNCFSLKSISIPETVTTIGTNSFKGIPSSGIPTPTDAATLYTSPINPSSPSTNPVYNYFINNFKNENQINYVDGINILSQGGVNYYLKIVNNVTFVFVASSSNATGSVVIQPEIFYNNTQYPVILIEGASFINSTISSITIPSSITYIGESAFSSCKSLNSITFQSTSTIKIFSDSLFSGCISLKSIAIPSSLTSIGDSTFSNSGISSIIIPSSVIPIGVSAFANCASLNSIIFQLLTNITNLSDSLFYGCISLKSIVIPSSLRTIGNSTFSNSGITSITVPLNVNSIGSSAFKDCIFLNSVTILSTSITTFDSGIFEGCTSLFSFQIPLSVTTIDNSAFQNSTITSISIPQNVNSIGKSAFQMCRALTSVDIQSTSIEIFDDSLFRGCSSLPSITIPSSLISFGVSVFEGCSALTSVNNIQNTSVLSFNDKLFNNCINLKSITVPSSVISFGNSVFENCDSIETIDFL